MNLGNILYFNGFTVSITMAHAAFIPGELYIKPCISLHPAISEGANGFQPLGFLLTARLEVSLAAARTVQSAAAPQQIGAPAAAVGGPVFAAQPVAAGPGVLPGPPGGGVPAVAAGAPAGDSAVQDGDMCESPESHLMASRLISNSRPLGYQCLSAGPGAFFKLKGDKMFRYDDEAGLDERLKKYLVMLKGVKGISIKFIVSEISGL